MKDIILAAGEGKRLMPYTAGIPKCMVKVGGKPLIQHQIDVLKRSGINDIFIVKGCCANKIQINGIKTFTNNRYLETNMVSSLFCAESELDGDVIVTYGDIVYSDSILEKVIKSKHDISVVIDLDWKKYWTERFNNPLDDAESLGLDNGGRIIEIGKPVQSYDEINGQYIGLMKFQNDGVKKIKEFYKKVKNQSTKNFNPLNSIVSFQQSYMTDFLQGLINTGCKLKAVMIENGWLELDSIDDYKKYIELFSKKKISEFIDLHD